MDLASVQLANPVGAQLRVVTSKLRSRITQSYQFFHTHRPQCDFGKIFTRSFM